MLRNEKGSALLTVMIMLLVFTTLGLVLLSVSINGAKRTAVREEEIVTNIEALTNLKEGVAQIQNYIADENEKSLANQMSLLDMNTYDYDQEINRFIDEINSKGYTITNLSKTPEYQSSIGSSQTRVLEVSNDYYSQKVYITATPSFLKYAVGSRGDLHINGSLLIDGQIYAKDSLNISNYANYVYKGNNLTTKTELPAVEGSNTVTVEEEIIQLCNSASPCYETSKSGFTRSASIWKEITSPQEAFSHGTVAYNLVKEDFIEVDLYQTFIDKLVVDNHFPESAFSKKMDKQEIRDSLTALYEDMETGNSGFSILDSLADFSQDPFTAETFYHEGNARLETDELVLGDDDWLIINGNADFESEGEGNLTIKGNILITGDVNIAGNLELASVMYSLGDNAVLNNADINGHMDSNNSNPTFIFLTDGNLEIAKINKFDSSSIETNVISGFIYTTKQAEMYGVGSLIRMDGGVFSEGDLVLNGFRGEAAEGSSDLKLSSIEDYTASRFRVKNNKQLFLDQMHALPRVDKLSTLTDRIEKK